jgi:hypothetical protein
MSKYNEAQKARIEELKAKFLQYYAELPMIRLACSYVGRSEDTIQLWRSSDSDFSAQIDNLKAEWAMKNVKGVKSKEWLLERIMRNDFAQRTEVTGADGGKLEVSIIEDTTLKDANRPSSLKDKELPSTGSDIYEPS